MTQADSSRIMIPLFLSRQDFIIDSAMIRSKKRIDLALLVSISFGMLLSTVHVHTEGQGGHSTEVQLTQESNLCILCSTSFKSLSETDVAGVPFVHYESHLSFDSQTEASCLLDSLADTRAPPLPVT